MNTANPVDTARLNLLLNELRLPAIKVLWPQFAEQSDKEGWPASRFLAVIAEHEIAERGRRRIERHLVEARLPTGKSHLAAAIGLALIENGWRVLFTRTTDLVQKLQLARRELNLEAAINRLDR